MNALVVLAHPAPKSFNYAIAEVVISTLREYGHPFIFHDLYREDFEPIQPAKEIPEQGILTRILSGRERKYDDVDGNATADGARHGWGANTRSGLGAQLEYRTIRRAAPSRRDRAIFLLISRRNALYSCAF